MPQHFSPAKAALATVLTVFAVSAIAGCYTVLKHPTTDLVADNAESQRDCYSCHGADGPAHEYDPLYAPGFNYYDDNWYSYYAYPWWHRNYWFYGGGSHGNGGGGGGSPGGDVSGDSRDDSRRHLWGRGPTVAPPARPPLRGEPATPPATGSADQPQGEGSQPGREMKNPPPDRQPSNGSDAGSGKKDSKEKDREVWGRGGKKP